MTAYLVTIEGLRGPELQIWYGEPGEFIGPKLETSERIKLPDDRQWTVETALTYVQTTGV